MGQQDRARPPSILDVARRAGVSYQTVSRVLNEHPQIRPETAERVQRAIGELGYRPNRAARALVTQRSRTIGILLTGRALHGAFSSYLAVVDAARAHGYAVTTTPTASDGPAEIARALGELLEHGVDGIIAIAPQDHARREIRNLTTRVPLVTMQGGSGELDGFGFDQQQAVRQAVAHLLALGHTRILHLPGPRGWAEADERALGYELGMREAGLEPRTAPPADWTPEGGQRAALAALPGAGITAVIAANDEMAIGALAAARALGLRVPDDLSVVGIDDVPLAPFVDPPLTTLRIDFDLLGRRALGALVAEVEGSGGERAALRIPPELIVRRSTAKVTDR